MAISADHCVGDIGGDVELCKQADFTATSAQTDLVEVLGQFDPKLVKMWPTDDRAED